MADIANLWVINRPKQHGDDSLPAGVRHALTGRGLFLDTCLRELCVGIADRDAPTGLASADGGNPLAFYTGYDAYRFILEVATGLRSAVPGETNVFGQFKKAWETHRAVSSPCAVARIAPVMHQLFNDCRSIRKLYLQGIGGSSYGTLVRRLLSPQKGERILFVGAGDLAHSLFPYFKSFEVGLWNHGRIALDQQNVDRIFTPEAAQSAAAWAQHVVLTTPPDKENDANWRRWLTKTTARNVIHLGHRSGELATWSMGAAVYDLDDVFALRRKQANMRSHQLERARRACRNAARSLTKSGEPVVLGRLIPA